MSNYGDEPEKGSSIDEMEKLLVKRVLGCICAISSVFLLVVFIFIPITIYQPNIQTTVDYYGITSDVTKDVIEKKYSWIVDHGNGLRVAYSSYYEVGTFSFDFKYKEDNETQILSLVYTKSASRIRNANYHSKLTFDILNNSVVRVEGYWADGFHLTNLELINLPIK